ncbi:MAG: 2-hydroxyacid dehydrogenase [Castellaniella sp.]|uniref:2-hydroxyacid dehydrogenase n=1 Tax=Castellaniella sp. TaxID=1955812 RepID=UPI003C71BA3F
MRPDLLQIGLFPAFVQEMIDARFQCHDWAVVQGCSRLRGRIRGIITRSNCDVPEAVFGLLPHLGVIVTYGVGYHQIPVELARHKGVLVAHTPGVLERTVAEFTLGLTLALLHRIPAADQYVRSGQWRRSEMPLGTGLVGKAVGIFGLGRLGKEIARCFGGLGVDLAYHGRTRQAVALRYEASLRDLARRSDILILAAPGSAQTWHSVDAEVLAALGPSGYLVNVARGSIVDEEALLHALGSGGIAGAALDVFANEPEIDPRFLAHENAVLTPHIGSAVFETRRAMAQLVLDNLSLFFREGTVLTPVPA